MKEFVKSHNDDFKLDKSLELNDKMTIDKNYQSDELTETNKNLSRKSGEVDE